ncbi:MAG: prolyl oligopeptidase family serine peptidase [Cyclobacteriaceae bacterium]|nr:prolyl oligopeptidase family serine peptidase [Cyclobacteriaceae bacterium]
MRKLFILLVFFSYQVSAQLNIGYQRPVAEIADLLEAPLTPTVAFSPDNHWMVLLDRSDYPSIEELSRPELRIAGLRINPENFGRSRGAYLIGLKFKSLGDKKDYEISNLPSPLLISDYNFSPDSKKLAFLQNYNNRIELWMVDMDTKRASKITERKINNVFSDSFHWLSDSEHVLFTAVPADLKPLTEKSRVPSGPVIEENLGKQAPSRTYQDLLENPYDEELFDYYGASEIVIKTIGGEEKTIAPKALYLSATPSPDGKMIMLENIHKPYSYLVPYYRFPQKIKIIDLNGKLIKDVIDIPLTDNIPNGFNATQTGPRNHGWRSDQPATIYWVEAQDGGNPKTEATIRDKVYQLSAPFTGSAREIISLPLRYSGVHWAKEDVAFIYESWRSDRKLRVYQLNPISKSKKIIFDRSTEDSYNDPGSFITTFNQYGQSTVRISQDNSVLLNGRGASPEGDKPFLDKMNLATGNKERLWQSAAPYYERVVNVLDDKKVSFVTSRESQSEPPNYFIRTRGVNELTQLTQFPHPYPQLKDVKKEVLHYKRADGVDLTVDMYLPPGYKKEDGPLPAIVWAYPREFKSAEAAGQVTGSPYAFTRINAGGVLFWVTRGYAVLDDAAMPIIGEGDSEPNDTYISQLVSSAKAVIDHSANLNIVDSNRVGIGGHSYGAFMTANLLAHSDLFKAGIARSGAYNRTLTPFGFQSEERTYWEAPEIYYEMSPFSYANKVNEPILLIHGEADNNSGTFPIQSERFYNAIKGHGGTARFVKLPYESHGYRAKESLLHMLWEMDNWLEKYVKNAKGSVGGDKKVDMDR